MYQSMLYGYITLFSNGINVFTYNEAFNHNVEIRTCMGIYAITYLDIQCFISMELFIYVLIQMGAGWATVYKQNKSNKAGLLINSKVIWVDSDCSVILTIFTHVVLIDTQFECLYHDLNVIKTAASFINLIYLHNGILDVFITTRS